MIENKKTVIGFSGRAHNGKTMLSDYLVREKGFVCLSVAHALKKLCASLLGFPTIDAMNEQKTVEKEYKLNDADILFLAKESGVPYEFVREELAKIDNTLTSVRHALQYIGTDIFRKYDADWHVKQLKKEIEESENDKIVIDDVRFTNEYNLMKELGATLIFIVRPVIYNVSHHKSDEELTWKMFDKVIINNNTKQNTISQLQEILETGENKIFGYVLEGYIDVDLTNRKVITDDYFNIKIINDQFCVDKFNITDNALIIEDLKKYLTYEVKKENNEAGRSTACPQTFWKG